MLKWWNKSAEGDAPSEATLDLDTIRRQESAILFKHSRTCGVSFAAQAEVMRFAASHPEIPVYTLVVQDNRELSREVAEWTGIRHESPQVFVLRRGTVVRSDSHEGVTAEFLRESMQG